MTGPEPSARTIILTRVDVPGVDTEELAADDLGEGQFVIRSIPFVDTHLALGDIVACVRVDGRWCVDSVTARGGNSTLRVLPGAVDVVSPLEKLGCRVEVGPAGLIAVNVGPDAPVSGIEEWLTGLAAEGLIDVSPGYLASRE